MELTKGRIKRFQKSLMTWHKEVDRPMPWKGIKDPYLVWLSEIILQQTRVEQGWDYFLKFKKAFPKIEDLANASEDKVMKLWQGLGYYSRARNLHYTAKWISENSNGQFEKNYDFLIKLKGVGPYTAAAIASFAFDLPKAVVDGNVYRVLSRIFGISTPIDSTVGKKEFQKLADSLLIKNESAKYNQAIIDFGATCCSPKKPLCVSCPFAQTCYANKNESVFQLPVKEKRLIKKTRYFNYIVIRNKKKVVLNKRGDGDIWNGLYDFPLVESRVQITTFNELSALNKSSSISDLMKSSKPKGGEPKTLKQQLTHQKIIATFFEMEHAGKQGKQEDSLSWISLAKLSSIPFPKIVTNYLKDESL